MEPKMKLFLTKGLENSQVTLALAQKNGSSKISACLSTLEFYISGFSNQEQLSDTRKMHCTILKWAQVVDFLIM